MEAALRAELDAAVALSTAACPRVEWTAAYRRLSAGAPARLSGVLAEVLMTAVQPPSGETYTRRQFLDFYGDGVLKPHLCALAPRTCKALRSLGWTKEGEILGRKQGWSVVKPGRQLGGHTGQALRINVQLCVFGCEEAILLLNGSAVLMYLTASRYFALRPPSSTSSTCRHATPTSVSPSCM